MQKCNKTITVIMVLSGILISGIVLANDQHVKPKKMHPPPHGNIGLDLLMKFQHENMMRVVLCDVTGQPAEVINQKLKFQHPAELIRDYDIAPKVFQDAIKVNTTILIERAKASGIITPEQQKEISEAIEKQASHQKVMKQLIEKGIEDGTITKDQIRMMLPEPPRGTPDSP